MKNICTLIVVLISLQISTAQQNSTFEIAPALTIAPASIFKGQIDPGISLISSYQFSQKWKAVNYTGISQLVWHSKTRFSANIQSQYDLMFQHAYGLGFQIKDKGKNSEYIALLGGVSWDKQKERIYNPDLNLDYTYVAQDTWQPVIALLYATKKQLNDNLYLSMRYYFPINFRLNLLEDLGRSSLEFGIGFQFP